MEWKPYSKCCFESAAIAEAAFCGECGAPLLRCQAYAECRSLVTPRDPCQICLSAALFVDQGAVTKAQIGHQLSVPLVLANTSQAGRSILVRDAMVRRDGEEFRPLPLLWERIDAGQERAFSVSTGALASGGTGTLDLSLTLATSYKGYEERYVYGSSIALSVADGGEGQVVQNIDFSGANFEAGGLVQIKDVAGGGDIDFSGSQFGPGGIVQIKDVGTESEAGSGQGNRIPLPFERYERFEIERGTRGYAETGVRVPRTVPFRFSGFPSGHAPKNEISLGSRGALSFGRNSRKYDAEHNPTPSDVVLRALDPETGALDAEGSYAFSRHHFDLTIQNDRLCAHVHSGNGLQVNDELVPATKLHVLADGDRLTPVVALPDLMSMRVRFFTLPDGTLQRIRIERTPDQAA